MKKFYILWNPTYPAPPKVQFETRAEAITVAKRMVDSHDAQFFVLEAKVLCERARRPIKTTTLK